MNFKKTLSLVLAVLMVVAVVPFSGLAADCEHDYVYDYYKNDKHIVECSKCTDVMEFENCSGGEATCGQQAVCQYCGTAYGETPDHDFTAAVEEDKYIATEGDCQTEKTYYYSCSVCGASSEGEEDEATFTGETVGDHVWNDGESNEDATCTEDGTKEITCTVEGCGKTEDVADEGSALGHDFTERIMDEAHLSKEATCQKRAVYFYDCSRCDFNAKDLGEDEDKPVYETDFSDHNFIVPDAPVEGTGKTPATCTRPAVFYQICSECHISAKGIDETKVYEDGGLAEHNFVNNAQDKYIVSAATCTSQAIYSKSCSDCGIAAVVNSKGEDLTTPGFDPTDINLEVYVEGDEDIPEGKTANAFYWGAALNHGKTYISTKAKEPTCTEDGCTEAITCEYCKVELTPSQKIDKLGHDYADKPKKEYKAPTCKQYGTIGEIECERCKATFAINEKGEMMSIENVGDFIFALEPLGHEDKDGDQLCDRENCGAFLEPEDTCSCLCHGTGIMYFVGLILKWFWKLTGTQPYCKCGNLHYALED